MKGFVRGVLRPEEEPPFIIRLFSLWHLVKRFGQRCCELGRDEAAKVVLMPFQNNFSRFDQFFLHLEVYYIYFSTKTRKFTP